MEMRIAKLGLCAGRHDLPAVKDGYVFDEIEDVTDVQGLELHALCVLKNLKNVPSRHIDLYVTGLTVALVAFLNAVRIDGQYSVTLWHYNSATGTYFAQPVEDWVEY